MPCANAASNHSKLVYVHVPVKYIKTIIKAINNTKESFGGQKWSFSISALKRKLEKRVKLRNKKKMNKSRKYVANPSVI